MKMRSLGIHPNPIGLVSLRRGRDFPSKPLVKTLPSNAGAVGSIPGQGTRPHMLQPRVCMPQLKIPHAPAMTEDSECRD